MPSKELTEEEIRIIMENPYTLNVSRNKFMLTKEGKEKVLILAESGKTIRQITPENESKWGSIEGNARGSFNWGSDNAYNYAKQHNIPFKFHCLIWGAQYPNWINSLSKAEQDTSASFCSTSIVF